MLWASGTFELMNGSVASRGCRAAKGTEARRFMKERGSCEGFDAGNVAEGDILEYGRAKQVMERLTILGGGVGGVAIHVGVDEELGPDACRLLIVRMSSDGDWREIDVVGVHMGDAVIGGSGRKPEGVDFL